MEDIRGKLTLTRILDVWVWLPDGRDDIETGGSSFEWRRATGFGGGVGFTQSSPTPRTGTANLP